MKVQDLCSLQANYHEPRSTCQTEVLDFARNQIHYDYFFELFGYKMNYYPAIFDYEQIRNIALLFNGYSFCSNDYHFGIYHDYSRKVFESLYDNPYTKKIQNGEKSVDLDEYLNAVKESIASGLVKQWDMYAQSAYRELEQNLGIYLYQSVGANVNILLKNYIEDIVEISKFNRCHGLIESPDLIMTLSKVNDPEVLKYVYNCLLLTRFLDQERTRENMPIFVQSKVSQFKDVAEELQKHLKHPEDYERVKVVFASILKEYCKEHVDGKVYHNLLDIFASKNYSWNDVMRELSYLTPFTLGALSLYLVNDQNTLGSRENCIENSVEFLQPEFYSRSRARNSK